MTVLGELHHVVLHLNISFTILLDRTSQCHEGSLVARITVDHIYMNERAPDFLISSLARTACHHPLNAAS